MTACSSWHCPSSSLIFLSASSLSSSSSSLHKSNKMHFVFWCSFTKNHSSTTNANWVYISLFFYVIAEDTPGGYGLYFDRFSFSVNLRFLIRSEVSIKITYCCIPSYRSISNSELSLQLSSCCCSRAWSFPRASDSPPFADWTSASFCWSSRSRWLSCSSFFSNW